MRNKLVSTEVRDGLNILFDGLLVKLTKCRHISQGLIRCDLYKKNPSDVG